MPQDYTVPYGLALLQYLSRQTADPPAPGDNPYLAPLNASMQIINDELVNAANFRAALAASEGLLYHDGQAHFSHVTLSPLFEREPQAGRYYCLCGPFADTLTTIAGVANRIQLHPCFALFSVVGSPVTLNLSIMVTTLVAGNAKIVVYAADPVTQMPTTLLGVSGLLSTGTVGVKTAAVAHSRASRLCLRGRGYGRACGLRQRLLAARCR